MYSLEENSSLVEISTNLTWTTGEDLRRDTLYVVIPVTIIYIVIFVTGLIGNLVTCIVIANNKYMHTATNYYLFSLAISDLLLLITGLPQEMVSIWYNYPYLFGEVFCVFRGLAAETSANATVLTITAFTAERYIAICHPFLSHTMSKLSRAVKLIIVIWVVSFTFACPHAAQIGVVGSAEKTSCNVKRIIFDHSFEVSTLLFFVFPMILITVLYALIGLKLRRTNIMKCESGYLYGAGQDDQLGTGSLPNQVRTRRHQTIGHPSRRVVNMLAAVVVAFFVCWAPFHAQRLVAIYGTNEFNVPHEPFILHIYTIVTYISGILYYLSATINPILYHIMSLKFREAFKETMATRCWKLNRPRRGERNYYKGLSKNQLHAQNNSHSHSTDNSLNSIQEYSCPSRSVTYSSCRNSRTSRRTHSSSEPDPTPERQVAETNSPQFSVVLRLYTLPQKPRRGRRLYLCNVFKPRSRQSPRSAPQYYLECHPTSKEVPDTSRQPNKSISNSSLKDLDPSAMREELMLHYKNNNFYNSK